MAFFRNLSIGKKFFASFGVICLLFIITGMIMWFSSSDIKKGVGIIKDEVVPHTIDFIEIKKDIIQIQQWLSDISATRAAEGYDDGFIEAENYYKDAVKLIEFEYRFHDKLGHKEMTDLLTELRIGLDEYYEMGKRMAQAYIDGGPEKGNPFMDKFDPYAAKLSGIIDNIVENHKIKLDEHLERVSEVSTTTMTRFAIIFAVTLFVCLFIGTALSSDIKKRVNLIKDAFAKAINGDLTSTVKSDSKDEIGVIADSYNEFINELSSLIGRISNVVDDLGGSSKALSSVSDKMFNESLQTSEKANAVAAATEEMNVNMTGVASATEQTTTNIQMIVSAAEEMSATIQEIADNTSRGSEITRSAVKEAQDVSQKINRLGDSAKEINKVTETISDISEQTNLLALNATIEAARAGEAGKGFAVVASEIKALAQQTAEATNDINEKISGVQSTSGEAVDAIRHIVTVINDINEIVITVATSVEEQSATTKEISSNVSQASCGVQEVNENVNQVSAVTAEVAKNITDVSHSAQETNTGSEEVEKSAKALVYIADSLNEMIKHFKI
nr:methyl-accepting chemotaxis protein [uncultured Desulfobacter sp.]